MTPTPHHNHNLKERLIEQGKWTAPPKGVTEAEWAIAILHNYTHRFTPVPPHTPTDDEYARIQKELYGDN